MSDSWFSKGLNLGCGVIVALFVVFVMLPVGACVFFGMLGSSTSSRSSSASVTPSSTGTEATPSTGDDWLTDNDCGRLIDGADARGNARSTAFASWDCAEESEVGEAWDLCLPRRDYSLFSSRGCPGSQRCCPPGDEDSE